MNINWKTLGPTWRIDGIRHAQLLVIEKVPNVVPAAIIEPMKGEIVSDHMSGTRYDGTNR